jgi:hypothetical protein
MKLLTTNTCVGPWRHRSSSEQVNAAVLRAARVAVD